LTASPATWYPTAATKNPAVVDTLARSAAAMAVVNERSRELRNAVQAARSLRQKAMDIREKSTADQAIAAGVSVDSLAASGGVKMSAEEAAVWKSEEAAQVEVDRARAKFEEAAQAHTLIITSGNPLAQKAQDPRVRLGVALELVDAGRRLASLARHRGVLVDLAVDNLAAGAAKLTGLDCSNAAEIIRNQLPADDVPVPPIFDNDDFGAIVDFVLDQIGPVRATSARQLRDVLDTLVQVALDKKFELRSPRDGAVVGPDKRLKAEVVDQLLARLRAESLVAAGVGGRLLEGKRKAIAGPGRPSAPPAIEPPLWAQIGEMLVAEKGSRELKDDVWAPFAGLGAPKNKFFEQLKSWGKARDVDITEAKQGSPRRRFVVGVRLLKIV
jgi:hypothetical protein